MVDSFSQNSVANHKNAKIIIKIHFFVFLVILFFFFGDINTNYLLKISINIFFF